MEDSGKSYIRVVDYKTGVKQFKLDAVLNGLSMQMLIYLIGLCENAGGRYGETTVPAGVLYVPAAVGRAKEGRHIDEETNEKEIKKLGRMSGIILDMPQVVSGMERGGEGVLIPAEIDRNGRVTGSVYSLEQFRHLKEFIDKQIIGMAFSLREGDVPALPDDEKTCGYCDYSSVCGREKDGPLKQLISMKADKAWEEIIRATEGRNQD
jgi:ATP-dependent helicase/nuclease subunit B